MNIIFLGPPGAGKGTQSTLIQNFYNLVKISTGSLIRDEINKKSVLGVSIEQIVESGNYITDDIIMKLIEEKIVSSSGYVFDGVPRTILQAENLDSLLLTKNLKLDYVIELRVDEEKILSRILTRFICVKCDQIYNEHVQPQNSGICDNCQGTDFTFRADDSKDIIRKRFNVYNEKTKPLIDFYHEKGILHPVDGLEDIDNVTKSIKRILGSYQYKS